MSDVSQVPTLAGVHHLKLPVRDLDRSRDWYASRLGYRVAAEFVEDERLMGLGLEHPNGGPGLALRLDPARAEASAGFDYFAIGVPDGEAIHTLAAQLTDLGESHAGVHRASLGWVLPMLHDPDGHEVRFYTHAHHTETAPDAVITIHDPRESAERADALRADATPEPPSRQEAGRNEVEKFLAEILPRHIAAANAFHNGDQTAWCRHWSSTDPVTLFGAAASRSGWDEISPVFTWLATRFTGGTDLEVELLAAGVSGDLAYTVAYERSTVSVHGSPLQPNTLRVTQVYRREDGDWKLIHRHGDGPPVDQGPPGDAPTDRARDVGR